MTYKMAGADDRRKLDRQGVWGVLDRWTAVRSLFWLAPVAFAAACSHSQASQDPPIPPPPGGDAQIPGTSSSAPLTAGEPIDAGPAPPTIGALFMHTPVMSEMEWPARTEEERKKQEEKGIMRLGYLRQGAKVAVNPEPHVKPNCPEGWYELLSGGFVCGKHASLDPNHPKLKTAAHAPWTERALPYDYAYNLQNGTPLYRTVPAKADRAKFEPWLGPKKTAKTLEGNPYESWYAADAGASPASAATVNASDPMALGYESDGGLPWYLRDWDGGKPEVTLDDLRGGDGPIVRRMIKGFYASIDQQAEIEEKLGLRTDKTKWWRTTYGYLATIERMVQAKLLTDFHGVWLNGAKAPLAYPEPSAQPDGGAPPYYVDNPPTHLPLAIMLGKGKKFTLSADHKKATAKLGPDGKEEMLSRFTPLQLTGTKEAIGYAVYHEVEGGFWVRGFDAVVMEPGAPPADLTPGEKWIDVNLATQSLVAFEGDKAVFATLVSTGRKNKVDREKNHETKPGSFRIREKHIAETMDADTATDGPYSIEDVPWIMYFNGSIALHGAFWHANFGRMQSHGCVNLAPLDARALFYWTGPRLPEGWHSVWATAQNQGTRVVVHDATAAK